MSFADSFLRMEIFCACDGLRCPLGNRGDIYPPRTLSIVYKRTIHHRNQLIGYMNDRQEKQTYLALVNRHIALLVEQSSDLTDQVDTLKARKQETGHLNDLFIETISALISLKSAQMRLTLELGTLAS